MMIRAMKHKAYRRRVVEIVFLLVVVVVVVLSLMKSKRENILSADFNHFMGDGGNGVRLVSHAWYKKQ